MSDDLIRRSDVLDYINDHSNGFKSYSEYSCAFDYFDTLPSADRPQGEWIDMGDFEQCSVCKGTRLKEFQSYYGKVTWIKTPYCPNCGARMKGADDD